MPSPSTSPLLRCFIILWVGLVAARRRELHHEKGRVWPTFGNGLELTVVNALSPDMHSFFDNAVKDWQSGSPNGVLLTVEVSPDSADCYAGRPGQIIVCNGSFGRTRWVGLEISKSKGGIISSSRIFLNNFYWDKSSIAYRQYAMCHELGHGLSLAHQDEDFSNQDVGSCLDYSLNPVANMAPNYHDYDLLVELYGEAQKKNTVSDCGCPNSCSHAALERFSGAWTCRQRINANIDHFQITEKEACTRVSSKHLICASSCDPNQCNKQNITNEGDRFVAPSTGPSSNDTGTVSDCGCPGVCTEDALDAISKKFSCRHRINANIVVRKWSEERACRFVSGNHPICAERCDPSSCSSFQAGQRLMDAIALHDAAAGEVQRSENISSKASEDCDTAHFRGMELKTLEKVVGYRPESWGIPVYKDCRTSTMQYERDLDDGSIETTQVRLLLAPP